MGDLPSEVDGLIGLKRHVPQVLFWGLMVAMWAVIGHFYYHEVVAQGGGTMAFTWAGRDVEILMPAFFGIALVLPLLWVVARRTLSDLPWWQRELNTVVRALLIVCLMGALVQVVLTSFESRISTIFIVDTSASIPDAFLTDATAYVNRAITKKREGDEVRVIGFATNAYPVELGEGGRLVAIPRPKDAESQLGTDLAAALRLSYGMFPQDHLKRVVVLSDGNVTRGDFIAEAYKAEAYGIRLYNQEIEYEPRKEVLIRGVDVPESLKIGEPFVFTARVFATHDTKASLTLWQNDFNSGTQSVELKKGLNEVGFKTEVFDPGFREFRVEMKVQGEDHFKENNRFVYSANVRGKPRVLYLEGESRSSHYLQRALRDEIFDLEVRSASGVPRTLKELEEFDLVLMSDVAALNMSTAQMELIARYVRELGGGFIMAGGEDSFGPGGFKDTPMERLLPVDFEPKKKRNTPTLALMLVIDKSGSMQGDRMELAKDAAKAAVEVLKGSDKVGVLGFDDQVSAVVRMQSATNRVRILSSIGRISASGGTNIAGAMQEAYEQLALTPARLKHVILLSDGNSDTANIFSEVVPSMRIENMTVSTVAVGAQTDTTLLRRIAEGGGGRYYYTNDPYNVPRIFIKETNTVSRSSLVEEPFRPRVVKSVQALSGISMGSAPYLLGYVSTKAKPSAEEILQSETGEPLLARWRVGLGKSVAWTSDVKNRWAVEWVRWPGYGKFWSQLIRDTMRTDDRDTLAMRTTVERGEAEIVVDAIDDEDRFINNLVSTVTLTTPGGKKEKVMLQQAAPGRYRASVPLREYGSYTIKAQHDRDGDTIAVSLGTISNPYPQEYLFTEANREVLRRGASIARGGTNPEVETLFDPMGEEVKYRKELWPIFLMIALGLLCLDWMLRRLRLGGRTELDWRHVTGGKL